MLLNESLLLELARQSQVNISVRLAAKQLFMNNVNQTMCRVVIHYLPSTQ